jgi:type I restriction enzyme S subunit
MTTEEIPEGWKECKLGEFIDIKHGFAFKGKYITDEPTKNVLVTPGNFHIGGGFKSNKLKYFKGDYPCEYVLKENDVIVTMTDLSKEGDTLGYSAKVPRDNSKNYLHNQRIGLVRFLSNEVDKEFIYWLMRTKDYQGFIVGAASGTSVRHTSPTTIKEYQFLKPPLTEQRAIASVLSSLDDKIDLLHRENKTLEQMAETLFRQWFVEDADEGWETGILGDFVNITYGKNLSTKKLQNNGYPVFGGNGQIGFFDKYIYEKPQVLISCRGEASGTVNISLPKSFITNNSLILEINKRREITFEYLKYYALNTDFKMYVSGSAQPQITITDLYIAGFTLPDKKTTDCFSDIVRTWESKIINNQRQTRTLEKLRDTLLPKLMSGEVRVKI